MNALIIFIILTVVKAYYIMWAFMHLTLAPQMPHSFMLCLYSCCLNLLFVSKLLLHVLQL